MNAALNTAPIYSGASASKTSPAGGGGWLLILTALLAFAPLVILAPAIGWPASLGNPAAMQLEAIGKAPGAVQLGYGVYLLYSILVLPAMIAIAARVYGTQPGGLARPMALTVIVLAALSVIARSIGILRWLTVMPELSAAHAKAGAADKAMIEQVFEAVHTYGGGIGELLGVSLFMAAAVAIVCVSALRNGSMPKLLAMLGLVSAALLFGLFLPAVGVGIAVPVAAAVTTLSVWMLAVGVWMILAKH
jgi:Domain of unknown function (DUF4386)